MEIKTYRGVNVHQLTDRARNGIESIYDGFTKLMGPDRDIEFRFTHIRDTTQPNGPGQGHCSIKFFIFVDGEVLHYKDYVRCDTRTGVAESFPYFKPYEVEMWYEQENYVMTDEESQCCRSTGGPPFEERMYDSYVEFQEYRKGGDIA